MRKAFLILLAAALVLGMASAVAVACPGDAAGANSAGCPYHTPNSYAKPLAVGEKYKCAECGMEGTVTKDTLTVEHEGKNYYFLTQECKETFEKKVKEFYSGKK